ncbi:MULTISPECIES: RidA family protein [unclassified Thalassospira]|uniref:RidA family protein n=1 Tax=unclassified Thalassospira TaxID=2648997 RepID=UPI000A1FFDD3|nr:RidA family protein [Thalassospira sp. MCCC 1A01428]OSQ38701.1 endoribonuclease L-PSP [Thalassospira sp. MCCC 1A01428]
MSTISTTTGNTPAQRLAELGITLPPAPAPIANFVTHVREGNLLFLSGQGPLDTSGNLSKGKVGADVSIEKAYADARLTGINLLAVMQEALGDLGRVKRVVKLLGMVNAAPDFCDHPAVINGCSDLFNDVFGPQGVHARSAIGMGSLPNQITVEIEAIIALNDE